MALTNVKTTDVLPESPTHAVGGVNSKQDTSKGVELDFGTRLDFGTGHGDVIITYADGTSTTAINPALQATDFPRRKYSILAKSTWTTGPLKGVMVGGAIMDQSAKREGTYQLDFPLTAAVFAGYQYNEHWYFQGNIDNLTDERYVVGLAASGLAMAADSRTLRLMIGYKF
jgi:outer membrane receptor protein involved in Fe transport